MTRGSCSLTRFTPLCGKKPGLIPQAGTSTPTGKDFSPVSIAICGACRAFGTALFQRVCELDLEGIVAKQKSAPTSQSGREELFERERHSEPCCGLAFVCISLCGFVNYPSMPKSCEVVELRNSADVVGYPCPGAASKECSDCGIRLCEDHAETCGTCRSIFCPPCRFLHRAQHSKPAHGERRERKRA